MRPNWQRGVLYVTIAGTEACWLYAIIALINGQALNNRLSVIGLLLLLPVAFGFNLLLLRLRWHKVILGAISWVIWVAVLLLIVKYQIYNKLEWSDTTWLKAVPDSIANLFYGFRPELLILIATGVIWWLGKRLASLKLNFAASVAEFQFGLAILLISFFSASQAGASLSEAVPVILVFFLFALLGMSLAHAREGKGWLSGLHRPQWSMLLFGSIGVIVALGFLIGSIVSPDFLQTIVAVLKYVWGLIEYAIKFLASLFPASEPSAIPTPPSFMPNPEPSPDEKIPWVFSEETRLRLQLVWSIVVGGLVLFALWRISSQIIGWLRRRIAMSGVEMEPMTGAFRSDFLSLLKLLFKKLSELLTFKRKSGTTQPTEAASVRQTYRQLLGWAAAHGYRRRTFQTPFEYYFMLAGVLPEAQTDLDFITRQYVKVRYNAEPPEGSEISQMRQNWHNIRQIRLKKKATGDKTDGKDKRS